MNEMQWGAAPWRAGAEGIPLGGVIFDMDGLMFDTERLSTACWKQVGEEFGVPISDQFLAQARGTTTGEFQIFFQEVFGKRLEYSVTIARKRELFAAYLRRRGVPIKPGLKELLNFLREEHIPVAMATATKRETAMDYVTQTGVAPFFQAFAFGDEADRGKPDPEIFYLAARRLSARPGECLVLEDSWNGVAAGIAGGFFTIMVPDLSPPAPEQRGRLFAVCGSLAEVIPRLEECRDPLDGKFYL